MFAGEQDGDEIDFAVLRMTLGIPGFDEKQLPRAVAVLCLLLIMANRQFSPTLVTEAQVRVEPVCQLTTSAQLPSLRPGVLCHSSTWVA